MSAGDVGERAFGRSGEGTPLWNLGRLRAVPDHRWAVEPGRLRFGEEFYANEPDRGRPTEVFARVPLPDSAYDPSPKAVPGMVLVHGGGGASFSWWATQWAWSPYAVLDR